MNAFKILETWKMNHEAWIDSDVQAEVFSSCIFDKDA